MSEGAALVMVRHQEITEAVLMEDCLSDTLHGTHDQHQTARAGIFIVQGERLVFVNRACVDLIGVACDQLLGRHPATLLMPQHAARWQQHCAAGPTHRVDGELALRSVAGVPVPVSVTITPTLFNGQPALLGTFHSIAR